MRIILAFLIVFGKKKVSVLWLLGNKLTVAARIFYYFVVQEEGE